uniref:Ig-like domain-containing protein n=1 Tax=Felis catus TaxID=9685 RepID=A0ABI7YPH9_FELCA
MRNLEVRKHPDFQGKDSSRRLWNAITQDSRAPTIHILPCSTDTISSTILLLAQERSSKRRLQFLQSSAMSLVPVPMLVFMILFAPRGAGAQSVTQPDVHITVSEGAPLELRCNYSSSLQVYLFWYMQHPNQGLRLLLKYISGDILVKGTKGFEAEFRKSEKTFHLRKPAVQWSDTAKYFCAVSDTVPGTAGGAEHQLLVNVRLPVTQGINLGHFQ